MLIHNGTQERLLKEATLAAGTTSREGSIQSDSLLVTLWVDSVSSGALDVDVYTLTDNGKEVLLFSFPQITAPSTELLLKKSGITMQRFRVVTTYSGVCDYEIYVRAIEGAGESSVRIIGPANLETSQIDIPSTPTVLIPAALEDRIGVTIKNYAGGSVLYVSESSAKLPANAWPITPGEVWSLDVAAGATIYAQSGGVTLDVRVAQAGG